MTTTTAGSSHRDGVIRRASAVCRARVIRLACVTP
jgi:hypothetical protein